MTQPTGPFIGSSLLSALSELIHAHQDRRFEQVDEAYEAMSGRIDYLKELIDDLMAQSPSKPARLPKQNETLEAPSENKAPDFQAGKPPSS